MRQKQDNMRGGEWGLGVETEEEERMQQRECHMAMGEQNRSTSWAE